MLGESIEGTNLNVSGKHSSQALIYKCSQKEYPAFGHILLAFQKL